MTDRMKGAAEATAPLSFAQQRMWFHGRLDPESALYNGSVALRWLGTLDRSALERSLTELVRRHEVLRTRYPTTEQGPVQAVAPAAPVELPVLDLTDPSGAAAEGRARQWLRDEARRPFSLADDLPLRVALLRLGAEDYVLAIVIHHVAFDRWSRGVLRHELVELYTAFALGKTSPLPEPTAQYRDYAREQQDESTGETRTAELRYWRERLQGAPAVMEMPVDRPRPQMRTHVGEELRRTIPPGLIEGLTRLGREERATLYMALSAGFLATLHAWTGQADLIVGSPSAGRTRPAHENLIGCFTDTLVLRVDLAGDPTFRELLRRVRGVVMDAYAHQVPFEQLVRTLQPSRDSRYHPVFQVMFNYLDFADRELSAPGAAVSDWPSSRATALVDLSVDVRRADSGGRACDCTYSTDIFDPGTVSSLMTRYIGTLSIAADRPDEPLSTLARAAMPPDEEPLLDELDRLSDEEAERLLEAQLRDMTR